MRPHPHGQQRCPVDLRSARPAEHAGPEHADGRQRGDGREQAEGPHVRLDRPIHHRSPQRGGLHGHTGIRRRTVEHRVDVGPLVRAVLQVHEHEAEERRLAHRGDEGRADLREEVSLAVLPLHHLVRSRLADAHDLQPVDLADLLDERLLLLPCGRALDHTLPEREGLTEVHDAEVVR